MRRIKYLENFEKIGREQKDIAIKYSNNTKKTQTKQDKSFTDKVNKIIDEDINLINK